MSFLAPLAFLGALLAIPILLLYMLRLRRREVVISSTFLWQQILKDTEANTPWQRLRRNLLLFLQLIILALLVLALARPFITVPTVSAGKTALLIDASASMNATDVDGSSRFASAISEANAIISNMNPADTISIIRVGETAEAITPYTGDFLELRGAINAMQAGEGKADWDTALTLAAAGLKGAENFNIVIISDGGVGDATNLPANIPQPIHISVGESSDNLAITALATRALAGEAPQLFAQVTNFGDSETEISLLVRLDGTLRFSRTATIGARSQLPIAFEDPITDEFSTIEAELLLDDNVVDYLDSDNRAWTVQQQVNTRRTLLMTPESNVFLEQVLRSLAGVQTFKGDTTSGRLPNQDFDLYIFSDWLPNSLPDGDMLIINPPRTTSLFTIGEEIENTRRIEVARPDDPRMAFVDVDALNLRVFRDIEADWADPLIVSDGGALLLAGENDGRQIAILTFDIRDSDLPLQITWPILISNLLEWFTPSQTVSVPDGLSVGDTVVIRPPIGADSLRVTLPSGDTRELPPDENLLFFTETTTAGLYTLDVLSNEEVIDSQPFAVNLFTTGESDITPQTISLGGTEVTTDANEQLGVREFWSLVAFLALLVLLIEWYVYHQRLRVPTIMTPLQRRRVARTQRA